MEQYQDEEERRVQRMTYTHFRRVHMSFVRSCWSFSAIGAVQGINKIVIGELISLSEQELVGCDTGYNMGCNGGLMDYAFEFIINNGDIDSEEDYPYRAVDGICDQYRKNVKVVSIDSYKDVNSYDESALKKAVANQPVSVAIERGGREFQLCSSGVFSRRCGTTLDHGVVVVEYGTENDHDYWIMRNSWGADWGEEGYIRIERNLGNSRSGKCGIAIEPSYPVKSTSTKIIFYDVQKRTMYKSLVSLACSCVFRIMSISTDEFYGLRIRGKDVCVGYCGIWMMHQPGEDVLLVCNIEASR
ncbi:cysteine proteinase RD21A [Vigna radiata var. radiata]|uniref:Cysteine proteinase RD21A n=1 Tax=Vigna radiata var. radiata TaxID=3916 RepID=A0A3Q0EW24_VIGRR|nr:cysteine proteinase RD21A [Vigna radiata var. radiata]